jgi:hypothetical protein
VETAEEVEWTELRVPDESGGAAWQCDLRVRARPSVRRVGRTESRWIRVLVHWAVSVDKAREGFGHSLWAPS